MQLVLISLKPQISVLIPPENRAKLFDRIPFYQAAWPLVSQAEDMITEPPCCIKQFQIFFQVLFFPSVYLLAKYTILQKASCIRHKP